MLRVPLIIGVTLCGLAHAAANYDPQHDGGESDHTSPIGYAGNDNLSGNQDYTDASPNAIGASHGGRDPGREAHVSWSGDLDPKSRSLQGTITIRPGRDARNLDSWKLYPSGDGTYAAKLPLDFADGSGSSSDTSPQYTGALGVNACGASCLNNSPYSPTCTGDCRDTKTMVAHDGTRTDVSRERITIVPGDGGEFYISRVQNQICEYGTAYDPGGGTISGSSVTTYLTDPVDTAAKSAGVMNDRTCQDDATQRYEANEEATITLPIDGWLTLVLHDFDSSATLGTSGYSYTALAGSTSLLDKYTDVSGSDVLTWSAGSSPSGKGWTFLYQPNYPEVVVDGLMANAAAGFVVVGVYGDSEDGENTRYVETNDWIVPNVTCTPTTMHCPIPNIWAHIDYTTPSMYPEPAEGSCEQVKTGSSSLSACSDKTDTNTRWYATGDISTTSLPGPSASGDNEEDNGQAFADDTFGVKHATWAGNCGDATSYFWLEKIACGSTRTFHTDGRSLIEDSIVLSPTWESIRDILAEYYTTKAPLTGAENNVGFTFINADYHVAPVLPPKVECSCLAAMDAYASLLSVQSKTPTPGAPVTLDPEVLNTGSSKIVATLRMYHDPTYSLAAGQDSTMPIVVSRFYLEVSTKFTRNRITISDCTASNREQLLNGSSALKPRTKYCDNSTFDTRTESAPAGVTHMDRISMKKFKFHTTSDVFMQCKIRACAAQPCGTCQATSRQLASSPDLSPVDGEMFAPPTKIRLSAFDKNALVFPAMEYTAPPAASTTPGIVSTAAKATTMPIQIASQMALPLSASWASENRAALISTLRSTLGLTAAEDLVIVSITAARRLSTDKRQLQTGSVKIVFVVGVSDVSRAQVTNSALTALSTGSATVMQQFVSELDKNLINRGKVAVALNISEVQFSSAQTTRSSPGVVQQTQQTPSFNLLAGSDATTDGSNGKADRVPDSSSNLVVILLLLVVIGAGALYFHAGRKSKSPTEKEATSTAAANSYSHKVAHDFEGDEVLAAGQ